MHASTQPGSGQTLSAWQIGEWRVDRRTNELRRGAEIVRIEPKAMDVLVHLAGRAGQVVTREELFGAVWPGVVVGDEALNQSIIKLRRALGDNSRAPEYIETIAKRGYRLVAPVARAPETRPSMALPEASPDADSPVHRVNRPRWWVLAGGLALLALIAGALYLAWPALHRDGDAVEAARVAALPTVAVLPFEPIGPDGDHEYLARGIGDDLATDLSRLAGLRLIRVRNAGSAGTHARYHVAGSVQRVGATLRINVRLTDGQTGEQLWAGRFERPFGDLFAVQDDIVANVVRMLPMKLTEVEKQRLAKRYTRSIEAYDHFLRGQAAFLVRQPEENARARALYRQAVELDPEFARAYAGLALTYAMETRLRGDAAPATTLERAFELAETARLIDPNIPEVHWALGFVHAQNRRETKAVEALERAIALDPSYADAYALLGGIHTYRGEPARSIPLLRTALRLNPDGGYLYYLLLGRAYLFDNDVEQALINLRAAALRNPVDVETRVYLAAALMASGDVTGARWEADEIRALQPGFATTRWLQSYPMSDTRQRERLAQMLGGVGL